MSPEETPGIKPVYVVLRQVGGLKHGVWEFVAVCRAEEVAWEVVRARRAALLAATGINPEFDVRPYWVLETTPEGLRT